MAKVRAVVTMYTDLEWFGEIPDDVRETDYFEWVRDNVDGSQYSEHGGDWKLWEIEVLNEDEKI
jgi:hypothetical protein